MHSHIAKQPVPPREVLSSIPKAVSDIVMKLMAKNAEDRYQSAYGVRADLEYCLANLGDIRHFEDFKAGRYDFSNRFQIPQRLYGRENEIAALLETLERVCSGNAELVLVTGHAGTGKTALVYEVHKPMTEKRGYFIAGKFDRFQRDIPYSAIAQAFHQFCEYVLAEPVGRPAAWRRRIEAAAGSNGQVLVEFIPDLERIIGPQPPPPPVGPKEAQNRFQLCFQSFVQAIGQSEHPLILFLDDVQWADSASLDFIKLILANPRNQHLLAICAYRDNEVPAGHPLLLALNELEKAKTGMTEIHVGSLGRNDVSALVADCLSGTAALCQPLADLVYSKTLGNAFFVNQFLQSLYDDDLLVFYPPRPGREKGKWNWNIDHIQAKGITDNVVGWRAKSAGSLRKSGTS